MGIKYCYYLSQYLLLIIILIINLFCRDATVPDIKKQLKNAEQKYGQLEDHVQQLETEADRVYDDAGAVANDAAGQLAVCLN